jgi:hypothetical protein
VGEVELLYVAVVGSTWGAGHLLSAQGIGLCFQLSELKSIPQTLAYAVWIPRSQHVTGPGTAAVSGLPWIKWLAQ